MATETTESTISDSTPTVFSIVDKFHHVSFYWYDYLLFSGMLGVSVAIGIYFGCFGSKQNSTKEYLLGGKTMKAFPIAVSLVASHISGITILGVPADVYKFGASYSLIAISFIFVIIVTIYVFLPIFYTLQVTSTYEYLEKRFDLKTREFASFLFAVAILLYLPIVIYLPALAFSSATNIGIHIIAPVVCAICIFYTTIGGLKAVVWTDNIQFAVTSVSLVIVFILGFISAGGFVKIFQKAANLERLDIFVFNPDPTLRDSFWNVVIGFTLHQISLTSVNQSCIQKFLAISTLREAKLSMVYYGVGSVLIKLFCVAIGLIMVAKYAECDPFLLNVVTKGDQMLPFYVMDVAYVIPGLPGLFIAGVFSSALSALSAHLNCLAGTIYEDFVLKFMSTKPTEKTASNILKIIVVIIGIIATSLVFIFSQLGGILQLAIAFSGVTQGPLLGLFILAALFPKANSQGALAGGITSVSLMGTYCILAKYYEMNGLIPKYDPKPLSLDKCDFDFNVTEMTETPSYFSPTDIPKDQAFHILRISHYYYTFIGSTIAISVGLIVSYFTRKKTDKYPHKDLLSPVIHFMVPNEEEAEKGEYYSINKALHIITVNSEKESNGDLKS